MADNTTTIEIRLDQRDALQDRKQHDRESYKAVLDRLLADGDEQNGGEIDTEQLEDTLEAMRMDDATDELLRRIDDLETEIQTLREGLRR